MEATRPNKAQQDTVEVPRLVPVAQWANYAPWPSVLGMRRLVRLAPQNGANAWIRRVGHRVLVDTGEFYEWIARQNPRAGPAAKSA